MKPQKKITLLVVCTGNTCRSVMAAALLRHWCPDWDIEDAGVSPGKTNGFALRALQERGLNADLRDGRSWELFQEMAFDEILVLSAKAETALSTLAPKWKLTRMVVSDPADANGAEEEVLAVYRETLRILEQDLLNWIENRSEDFSPST